MRPPLWKQRWCRRLMRPSRTPGGTPAALTQQVRKVEIKAQVLNTLRPVLAATLAVHCSLSAGVKAKAMIKQSRESVARLVGGQAQDIIFTSGGTEVCIHQADGCLEAGFHSCFMSD